MTTSHPFKASALALFVAGVGEFPIEVEPRQACQSGIGADEGADLEFSRPDEHLDGAAADEPLAPSDRDLIEVPNMRQLLSLPIYPKRLIHGSGISTRLR